MKLPKRKKVSKFFFEKKNQKTFVLGDTFFDAFLPKSSLNGA
jgi:hypothetical protein